MNRCLPRRVDHEAAVDCTALERLEVLAAKVGGAERVNHHANIDATLHGVAKGAEQGTSDQVLTENVINYVDRVFGVLDHPDLCGNRGQRSFI